MAKKKAVRKSSSGAPRKESRHRTSPPRVSSRQEREFLAAIAERPGDAEPRLVFADWLEERGDPRGELIRLEERCRSLPLYSDEYWQLKPRRNELRRQCGAEFLKQIDYGQAYLPVFGDVPTDWQSRMRLLREFVARWHQREMPDIGRIVGQATEIAEEEGRPLPAALVEWMAFEADLFAPDREAQFRVLRTDRNIQVSADHLFVVCYSPRTMGTWIWVLSRRDLDQADPPVEVFFHDYLSDETNFIDNPTRPLSVSDVALNYIAAYAEDSRGFNSAVESADDLIKKLRIEGASCSRVSDFWIIEGRGWFATVNPVGESDFLSVRYQQGISNGNKPAILRELEGSLP